jgi:hypothetical protein
MRYFFMGIMVLLIALGIFGIFYIEHYHALSARVIAEENIDGERANAFKHTYAAGEAYTFFAQALSAPRAERTVSWLGRVNEHIELTTRSYPKNRKAGYQPDTTIELIKDLYNNHVGIVAAQWHATHAPENVTLYDILLRLVATNVCVIYAQQLPIPEGVLAAHPYDIPFAQQWVKERHAIIRQQVEETLATLYKQ